LDGMIGQGKVLKTSTERIGPIVAQNARASSTERKKRTTPIFKNEPVGKNVGCPPASEDKGNWGKGKEKRPQVGGAGFMVTQRGNLGRTVVPPGASRNEERLVGVCTRGVPPPGWLFVWGEGCIKTQKTGCHSKI